MILKKQKGFLTLILAAMIVIVGFIGVAIAWMTFGSGFAVNNFQEGNSALFLAESGLEQALHKIYTPTLANRVSCASLSTPITNNLGSGSYSTTVTGITSWPFSASNTIPNPNYVTSPTTLNGALTATSSTTSITVTSTANYQPFGRIMVDRELINYTYIDATHFNGIERAVDGSTLAAHANGAPVAQFQCNLTSTGGSPTLTPTNPGDPGGVRKISQNIQLQEAWTVGAFNTTNPNLGNYRETVWAYFTNSFASSNLNSISMVSYADGWAVGDVTTTANILHWNGSTWAITGITGLPARTLNSVYCVSGSECYAAGDKSTGKPFFVNWTGGPNWVQITPGGSTKNKGIYSVHCPASNNCWAIGQHSGSNEDIYFWNGSTWTGSDATSPPNSLNAQDYFSVFCAATNNCWTVGVNAQFGQYNGTGWSNFSASTAPSNLPSVQYNSVFCNSTSDCWAVGAPSAGAVIGHWDGTKWTRDTTATANVTAINLEAVTCANSSDCWVVGDNTGGQPVIAHYDGTNWNNVTISGFQNAPLLGVDIIRPQSKPFSAWQENFS